MKRLLVVLLALLMLTGCSSSNNSNTDDSGRPVLRVAMECDYAPFNWTQVESNEFTVQISSVDYTDGYDVQIARLIAEAMNMDLQIVKTDWDALVTGLNEDAFDLIIAGMTDTPARREEIDFTTPYYESDMVIICKAGSEVASVTDIQQLANYHVVGQKNTSYDEIIDQINGIGKNHLTPKDTYPELVLMLQAGEADATTAEVPVAEGIVAANPDLTYISFADGHGFDVDTSVSIGIKKGSPLFNDVQKALDSIDQNTRIQLMLDATNRQPAVED